MENIQLLPPSWIISRLQPAVLNDERTQRLYTQAHTLQPKMVHTLEDTIHKHRAFVELHEKIYHTRQSGKMIGACRNAWHPSSVPVPIVVAPVAIQCAHFAARFGGHARLIDVHDAAARLSHFTHGQYCLKPVPDDDGLRPWSDSSTTAFIHRRQCSKCSQNLSGQFAGRRR
ncbi:hypothetical protein BC940DRAFT_320405 [Gongronella butleri]|nr:hypothetical protein BC940DRAFT_320405 [Gongronella butleri]